MQFNLVDEAWIPCIVSAATRVTGASVGVGHGMDERRGLGLRDVLVHAHDIKAIDHASPLVTISLYRLLLAVLYRTHGPIDRKSWLHLWYQGAWDSQKIDSYLSTCRDRFNLFDGLHPFYQTHNYGECEIKPIALLAHELASGNNSTLFDHTTATSSRGLNPAEAACYLIAHQAYALCGTVSLEKGASKNDKSAGAGPLVGGAVVLARGRTLFETLLLNLCYYPNSSLHDSTKDMPAWERADDTRPDRRHPDGYIDLLTWQSRRIRLFPSCDDQGRVVVDRVSIMKGYRFTPEFQLFEMERMMAFRSANARGAKGNAFPSIAFKIDRALWRDSTALLQSVGDYNRHESTKRPYTLDWLEIVDIESLIAPLAAEPLARVPLDVFGVHTRSGGGSLRFWRHERLPLPLAYLHEDKTELFAALAQGIRMAEEVGVVVWESARKLTTLLLAPATENDKDRGRSNHKKEDVIIGRAATLGMTRTYWSRLSLPFNQLLLELPTCEQDDGTYGSAALRVWWTRTLQQAARDAFEEGARGLDTSPRLLKAVARAENQCRDGMNKAVERWLWPDGSGEIEHEQANV